MPECRRPDHGQISIFPNFSGATATAGAIFALLAGFSSTATALPGMFGDGRPTVLAPRAGAERPFAHPAARPAARPRTLGTRTPAKEPAEVARPKGPLQILISLDRQHLTLYAGGQPIAHSRVSTGQRGYTTFTGVFSIIQKDRWHRSNLYDNAPMWYMQRITWSGTAMHQGIVPNYPASHGCIRLPEAFARQLWGITSLGARVIITKGEVTPQPFEHAKLFLKREAPPVASVALPASLRAAEAAWDMSDLNGAARTLPGVTMTDIGAPPVMAFDDARPTRPLKPGPIAIFISRKEGKIFVRKGFEPVFDMPVEIDRPDVPLGTHVLTALAANGDGNSFNWNVVTLPSTTAVAARRGETTRGAPAPHTVGMPITTTAAAALDRITIPQEALDRIGELMSAGASLTIADKGLGTDTGRGTDFIVRNP
jgi:lipoprotein-anchoring transpeptidase ErfK/SrfK